MVMAKIMHNSSFTDAGFGASMCTGLNLDGPLFHPTRGEVLVKALSRVLNSTGGQ